MTKMFKSKCVLFFLINSVIVIVSGLEYVSLGNSNNGTATILEVGKHRRSRAYSGDDYLDEAYDSCIKSKNIISCVKHKALRYIHNMASPNLDKSRGREGLHIFGTNVKLIRVPENMSASKDLVSNMLPDTQPNSTDSELGRLYKFVLREVRRFVGTHAITVRVPYGPESGRDVDSALNPRLVDEEDIGKDVQDGLTAESRGKKKKLAILLPLLLFLKLKILLVPILLAVLFIKKLLIIATVLLPSLLSMVKFCKQHHGHTTYSSGWSSGPDTSGEYSTSYAHAAPYHVGDYHGGDYHGRRVARWDNLPYRGHHRTDDAGS